MLLIQAGAPVLAQDLPTRTPGINVREILPLAQSHPLPSSLALWQDLDDQGDYFAQVRSTSIGYLIWSHFPIRVYIEPAPASTPLNAQAQLWVDAVIAAMRSWQTFLPIEQTDVPETADIAIWRKAPPLTVEHPRAQTASSNYEVFVDRPPGGLPILSHHFTILLTPNQPELYTEATARHELGHALGIWGHSSLETDALYFAQVRCPPPISVRDINTLRRIYQQPTRLGWSVLAEEP
jgi:predicted Zn-dependent protease